MPSLFSKAPDDPKEARASRQLDELLAQAEAARDSNHFDDAIEYLQAALEISPLNRRVREQLAETLLDSAEARAGCRKRPENSSRVLGMDLEDEDNAPRQAKSKAPKAPPKTRRRAAVRPQYEEEHASEASAGESDGFAALDGAMAREHRRRGAKSRGQDAQRPPRRHSRSTTRPRRAWIMAFLYAGVLLIAVGLSHGMIVRLMAPAALPSVEEKEEMPELLVELLRDASDMLADGKSDSALELLKRARVQYPEHDEAVATALAQAHRISGGQLMGRREYSDAVEQFEAAVALASAEPRNWVELGRAYREYGRSEQARDSSSGTMLLRKAQAAYGEALAIEDENPGALLGMAQVHAFMQERGEAVRYYETVVKTAPDSPEARLARQHLAQLRG